MTFDAKAWLDARPGKEGYQLDGLQPPELRAIAIYVEENCPDDSPMLRMFGTGLWRLIWHYRGNPRGGGRSDSREWV